MILIRRVLSHSDFVTVPMAIAGMLAIWPVSRTGVAIGTIEIALGVVIWTLIEYWVHRAMHMRLFPSLRAIHMHHHQAPTAPSGVELYSNGIIFALLVAAVLAPTIAPFGLGLLIGYGWFIVLHHAEHHGWPLHGLEDLAAAHHLHHHAGPDRMFGVSTTVWDRAFGTA